MVGLGQDEPAHDRLMTITPRLASMVQQYLRGFPKASQVFKRKEHCQLTGKVFVRSRENALELRKTIELQCTGIPFQELIPLKSIVYSVLIPEETKTDILNFPDKFLLGK